MGTTDQRSCGPTRLRGEGAQGRRHSLRALTIWRVLHLPLRTGEWHIRGLVLNKQAHAFLCYKEKKRKENTRLPPLGHFLKKWVFKAPSLSSSTILTWAKQREGEAQGGKGHGQGRGSLGYGDSLKEVFPGTREEVGGSGLRCVCWKKEECGIELGEVTASVPGPARCPACPVS